MKIDTAYPMKAITIKKYGPPEVLQLRELPAPLPNAHQVLIKVHVSTINSTEPQSRAGKPLIVRLFSGLFHPKHLIPGEVFAGTIVEVGAEVTHYKKNDRVFGNNNLGLGAHAEYIALSEDAAMVTLPTSIDFADAAAMVDGGLTALPFLRDAGQIKRGDEVLIYGASGSVGVNAVQFAVAMGATVTAVCSGKNATLAQSCGAATVIDYTTTNFAAQGKKYDIIFDTVGKRTFANSKRALKKEGVYLTTVPNPSLLWLLLFRKLRRGPRVAFLATGLRSNLHKREELQNIVALLEQKKLQPIIDREYQLHQIAAAHTYVESGRKRGSVIVHVGKE